MTEEEYFNHLKVITENAGADKTGVKIETEDGYCISISVTKKQKKRKSLGKTRNSRFVLP